MALIKRRTFQQRRRTFQQERTGALMIFHIILNKVLWFVFYILVVYLLVMIYFLARGPMPTHVIHAEAPSRATTPNLPRVTGYTNNSFRAVHIDLKGAPPKIHYLYTLLPLLAKAGCNCLLLEYEDMFPYEMQLRDLSSDRSYSKHQLKVLISIAKSVGITIIPLIQSYGNMEFVFKHSSWAHVKEMPFSDRLCPSNPGSISLMKKMIKQVMAIHDNGKFIHFGGDEKFSKQLCIHCIQKYSPVEAYVKWMHKLCYWMKVNFPVTEIIVWDTVFRQWPQEQIQNSEYVHLVTPMIKVFSSDVDKIINPYRLQYYQNMFSKVWVAGAYKGIWSHLRSRPKLKLSFSNQESWLKFLDKTELEIAGYVLAGPSRANHYAELNELLPSSITSLFLNLIFISNPSDSKTTLLDKLTETLTCTRPLTIDLIYKTNYKGIKYCKYPGHEVFNAMTLFGILREEISKLETAYDNTKYKSSNRRNISDSFTSRIIQRYLEESLPKYQHTLETLREEVRSTWNKYFDYTATEEWINQRVFPLQIRLNLLDDGIKGLYTPTENLVFSKANLAIRNNYFKKTSPNI